ncbi:hypothetical protein GCM10008967_26210 [Bacillus carboniphilus]|uniref:Sporulation protein n=1 Tax=Bacillus carboniphilus TaxID=86663 RepID=A0ABN0WE79_9BACI
MNRKLWCIPLACLLVTGLTACNADDNAQNQKDTRNPISIGFSTNEKTNNENNHLGKTSNRKTAGYKNHGYSDFNYHHHADNAKWMSQRSFYEEQHGDLVNEITSEVMRVKGVKDARTIVTEEHIIVGVNLELAQDQKEDIKETVHTIREKVLPYQDGREVKVVSDRESFYRIEDLDNRLRTIDDTDQMNQEVERLLRTVAAPFNEQEIAN